jgi:hypothetical protein
VNSSTDVTDMFWFETRKKRRRRMQDAMANYPFYDRPHKGKPRTPHQAHENFEYFMSVRLERLASLQSWLHAHFDVNASFDGDGVLKTSQWLDRYAEGLIGNHDQEQHEFPQHSKWWTREAPSYSVLFDLGIFVGEFVIDKRPWCYWELTQGTPDKHWVKRSIAKLGPELRFHPAADAMSAMNTPWCVITDKQRVITDKRPGAFLLRARRGEFIRSIKRFLYNARTAYEPDQNFSLKAIDRESFERMPMGYAGARTAG